MNTRKLGVRMIYASVFMLLMLLVPAKASSEFPSNAQLRRTTISLRMAGFAFGSGLMRNDQGKPTGNGVEMVSRQWCGSGFLVGSDGTIVTNYHVARRALRGQAIFDGGAKYDIAHLRVYDSENDIAVMKINSTDTFATAPLGNSDQADVRDSVLAAGNGLCEGLSVADGKIIQIQRDERNNEIARLVHTASIAGGNSGGPLYKDERVIGINVAGATGYQRYYAIPINKLQPLLDEKYIKRVLYLQDIFPPDPQLIAKKSRQLFARSGQVGPASQQGPGFWRINADLEALGDYAIFVKTPSKKDLAIVILNKGGNTIGYGGSDDLENELVFLSSEYDQTVTIGVLNTAPVPVDFGVSLYKIRW
jgi:hypothetical protein